MKSLLYGFQHYVDFSGKDSRSTYWGFIVGTHLILILLLLPSICLLMNCIIELFQTPQMASLLQDAANGQSVPPEEVQELSANIVSSRLSNTTQMSIWVRICTPLAILWFIGILLPTISATARRLRDAGQSPWWAAAPAATFLPLVGGFASLLSLVTLIMCFLPTAQDTAPDATLPPMPEQGD